MAKSGVSLCIVSPNKGILYQDFMQRRGVPRICKLESFNSRSLYLLAPLYFESSV